MTQPVTLTQGQLYNFREDWLVHTLADGEKKQSLLFSARHNARTCIAGVEGGSSLIE